MSKETYCQRVDHELILRSFNESIEAALCCKAQNPINLYPKNENIEDVKTALSNGIKHKHCSVCWQHEKQGITSWRQIGNKINYHNRNDIELYLDNTCDLACVYCSKKYSSKWQQEIGNALPKDKELLNRLLNDNENFVPSNKKINHVERMLHEVTIFGKRTTQTRDRAQIMLLGGEPLLAPYIKKNVIHDIVDSFYKHGNSEHPLKIVIVTNGNSPDHIIDKTISTMYELSKVYKNIEWSIALSMESIGKTAEVIRFGLDYNQFIKNYKKYLSTPFQVGFNLTINTISFNSTPQFVEEMFVLAKHHNKEIYFRFNVCLFPKYLSVRMVSKSNLYIIDDIRKVIEKYKTQIYTPHQFLGMIDSDLKNLESYIDTEENKKECASAGLQYFDYLKRARSTDISEVAKDVFDYYMEIDSE